MAVTKLQVGDLVVMNGKYSVGEQSRGKIFTVKSAPVVIGGTECVFLEGVSGAYAADGLWKLQPDGRLTETKAEARLFANAFFGKSVELIGRDDEADKDSTGYLFKMGHITFDVFPVYGDGTEHDVLTAEFGVNGLIVGYAVSDMGDISFERWEKKGEGKAGKINIFYTDDRISRIFTADQCVLITAKNDSQMGLDIIGRNVLRGKREEKASFYYAVLSEITKMADDNEDLAIIKAFYEAGELPRYADSSYEGGEQDD